MLLKDLRDWCDGKPDCLMGNVAATRTVWAPFVDEWCMRMQQNFKPVLDPSPSRGHLGWCNSNKLWTTYWAELQKEPPETWFPAFGSYMPWAAATGTMEYFWTMPDIFWPLMRLRFEELDLIVDPDAILWFEQQFNEEADFGVRAAQIARWESLGWMGNQHRELGQARSDATHGIAEYLALSAKAMQVYGLDQNLRARIAGHLFMGSTPDAAKAGLVEATQGCMGHWGIDLGVVALCSGYAHHGVQGEPSAIADVLNMAGQFALAQTKRVALNSALLESGGYTAAMLKSMHAFSNLEGLYQAVQSMGLFSAMQDASLHGPLDSSVFESYSLQSPVL